MAENSPAEPPILKKNCWEKVRLSAVSSERVIPFLRPSLTAPSGVAPEKASTRPNIEPESFQVVISTGKETSRKTRPTRAGLKIFCPRPPKVILATPMATTEPMTMSHHGEFGGRLSASRQPVTTADRSLTVTGRLSRYFWIRNSVSTQAAAPTRMSISADQPLERIDTSMAGARAMSTSRMIDCVLPLPWV